MSPARVLVVDDSEITRAILARTLRGAGFEVLEARDGVEGAMAAFAERPAVVVTDLEMPTLDGFPLLRLLKADPACAHIPVLILTSHGEAAARFWSLRTGADAFLNKDFRPEQLVAAVSQLAAGAQSEPHSEGQLSEVGPLDVLARVARQLDSALLQATFINTLLERGMATSSFHEACKAGLETVGEVVDAHFLAVALAEPESASVHVLLEEKVSERTVADLQRALAESLELPPGTPVETLIFGERGNLELDLRRTVWAKLAVRGGRGVLALAPRDPWQFASATSSLLVSAIGHLSLVLDNSRLSERLLELGTLDGLTRQFNHRVIFDRLTEELERARRYDQPLSIVLCDLDHFKQINDSHGHLAGDAVLREAAALLRNCLRQTDLLGRCGGEEFLAVLPQIDLEAGRAAAERVRHALEVHRIGLPGGSTVGVTGSFGVAAVEELTGGTLSSDALVALADKRLYSAKAAGRNVVRP